MDASERLERARERAADRLQAIIGTDDWATFDHERVALVFSGFDLTGPDIIETAQGIGEPYSTAMVEAAVQTWRDAMRCDPDTGEALAIGACFGSACAQQIQGAFIVGLLVGLLTAELEDEATLED